MGPNLSHKTCNERTQQQPLKVKALACGLAAPERAASTGSYSSSCWMRLRSSISCGRGECVRTRVLCVRVFLRVCVCALRTHTFPCKRVPSLRAHA
jgi:hypothetical protein